MLIIVVTGFFSHVFEPPVAGPFESLKLLQDVCKLVGITWRHLKDWNR
jgi:hypothetical protein